VKDVLQVKEDSEREIAYTATSSFKPVIAFQSRCECVLSQNLYARSSPWSGKSYCVPARGLETLTAFRPMGWTAVSYTTNGRNMNWKKWKSQAGKSEN